MDVAAIRSARLELVPMLPEFLEPLLANRREEAAAVLGVTVPNDWPDDHDARFLRFRLRQMRENPASEEWLVRAVVLREGDRPVIGHVGFHGPPGTNAVRRDDAVEVGYTIFAPWRRRGYATEAIVALLEWAERERSIRHFVASVSPDNDPSLAIVRKLGFIETGSHWDDEDGLELEFQLARD